MRKLFYKNIRVVLGKKQLEKKTNNNYSRNETNFENRPSCKRYSPCEMVNFSRKLKMPKTCEKTFSKNIRVALCKKQLEKNPKHSRNATSCKNYTPCKMVSLRQKLKMPKACEKPFYKNIRVVLCKKPLEKTPNISEMRQF